MEFGVETWGIIITFAIGVGTLLVAVVSVGVSMYLGLSNQARNNRDDLMRLIAGVDKNLKTSIAGVDKKVGRLDKRVSRLERTVAELVAGVAPKTEPPRALGR